MVMGAVMAMMVGAVMGDDDDGGGGGDGGGEYGDAGGVDRRPLCRSFAVHC